MKILVLAFALLAYLLATPVARAQTNLVTLDPDAGSEPLNGAWSGGEWNTAGNFDGWTTSNITGATVAGGALTGTTSSATPQLTLAGISGGPDLDFAFNDYLDIRLKVPGSFSGDIQVHYGAANTGTSTSKTGFASDRIITIPNASIAKDGAFHVYRVDTSLEPWWRGTLSDLRLQIGAAGGVAFELDYLRVGDTGTVPTINGLDAACNRTVVARNFVFGWSDLPGAMGESLTDARARSNLRDAEECYAFYCKVLKYPRPRSGVYKINFVSMEGGYHAGTDGVRMNIDPTGLTTDPNPPSWVIPHELAHIFQGVLGPRVPGEYFEFHANYSRERWIKFMSHHYPGATNFEPGVMADMHLNLPTGRNYYLTWPFYLYLDTNPDNLVGLGDGTVASAWQNMQSGETMHDSLARTKPAFSIKDLVGYYARRGLTYDYPGYKEAINARTGGIWEWEQLTEPIRRPDDSSWWRVPPQRAPMQTGFTLTELVPSGTGAGRVVTVELKGLLGQNGEDWRASLVIINDSGVERYTPLFGNNGTGSVTLAADENRVYLAVAATPADYDLYYFDEASHPFRSDPAKRRFHYEFKVTGATPKERNHGAATGLVQHANGGGYKASTATVDATAFIGPNARVLDNAQVLGYARVEDYAVVRENARIQDSAIARGHAEVFGSSVMSGKTIIADFSRLSGSATLSGSARMFEHSNLSGGVATDQATLKGCAGSWGGTLGGNAIVDGDYAKGRDIHNAAMFGHKPWDLNPDSWLIPLPTGIFACYEFNAATDGIIRDTYAATDGLQRGSPSWVASDGGRNGILMLNGTDQWVQLERSVAEFPAMTVTTWVKWNGGAADQALFQLGDGGSKFIRFTPSNAGGVAELRASNGTNTYSITAAGPLTPGVWSQVAVSLDGTFGKMTVNGGTIASGSLPLRPDQILPPNVAASPAHNFIGRTTSGNFFSGAIDDFKVYGTAIPTFMQVTIAAIEPAVPENAPGATLRVIRESLTGSSTTGNLTVNYTVSGTAMSGDDFVPLSGSVVIPDGQSYADITMAPVHDDLPEGDETVILSLAASNDYTNSGSGKATITINNMGDLSSALLAWYKFNETSGTTAADSSGNGKHATLVNGPVWAPTQQALSFDDANDDNDSVQTFVPNGGTRTLSAWFRPESSVGIQNIWNYNAVFDSDVPGAYGAGWGVVNSTIRVMLDDQMWDTGVPVTLNQWQHGSLTFDNTRVRFYLNGALVASTTYGQGGITTANYTIGSKAFDGQIRDAKIYSRAVYDAEASEIYLANAPTLAPRNLTALAGHGYINLGWQPANAGETSYTLRRATTSGGPYTTIASGLTNTSYVDSGLTNGTTYYYVVAAANSGGTGPDSTQASATPVADSALPPPWQQGNVGTAAGSPTTTISGGSFSVNGAGERITNSVRTDSFRFVYIPVIGNCTLTAKVEAIGSTNTAAKAGVMIREFTTNNARHASTLISPASTNNRSFIRRANNNGNSATTNVTRTDLWVRIVRDGTSFTSFTSADGTNWEQLGTAQTVGMSTTAVAYAGLAVCSGNTTTLSNAIFSNVSITGGYPTGLAAAAGDAQVDLSWTAVPGATSYLVKRATTSGGPYTTLTPNPTTNSFSDTTATNGTRYFYVVSAHNGTAESANSSEVFATPAAPRPLAPANVTATDGGSQISLAWSSASGATSYRVRRATSPVGPFTVISSPSGTSFNDAPVDASTNYFYTVAGVNSDGEEGVESPVVSVLRALFFDPDGSNDGSVADGGTYSWLATSWAQASGGLLASQSWLAGKEARFAASNPGAPLAYSVDLANYYTGTHGNFSGIRALTGTVTFTGNVSNFYLTAPVTVTAETGAAIVFQQTRSGADVQAFNLNSQPATFHGDITLNCGGIGNNGSIIVGSGILKLGNSLAYSQPASTVLQAGTTLSNIGDAGKYFNLGALTLNGATLAALNAGSANYGNYTFSDSLTVGGTAASLISADIRCGFGATHTLNIGETGEEVDLLISGKLGHFNWYSWGYANKTGPGTLKLSGENGLGGMTVSEGTLILEGANAIAGMDVTSLTNNAAVILSVPTGTVTYPRVLQGTGLFTKTGAGTFELTNTSVHGGNVRVQEGILRMTQPSLGNASTITLDSGATIDLAFSGTDTIGGLVINGVTLPPGIYSASTHPASITGTGSLKVAASVILAWDNGAGTGIWNSSDANWTGQSWLNLADARISHIDTAQTITLNGGINAADVHIGNGSNNARYTLAGAAGASLSALGFNIQGASANDPGLGAATMNNLSASIATDLRVGRWDLVIGGTSTVNIAGQLRSTSDGGGSGDWGRVTIQDSANVIATGGVTGAGAVWGLTLNGGTLSTPFIRAAENAYGAGARLTLNGTTIRATQPTTTFLTVDSSNRAYLGTNGARFDTNGNDISVGVQMVDTSGQAGTLTKLGAGTLTLKNVASSYTGGTTVTQGTLTIDVQGNSTQSAVGVNKAVTVNSGATLRLAKTDGLGYYGANPSSLQIAGTMAIASAIHASIGNYGITLDGGVIASEGAGDGEGNYIFDGSVTTLANANNALISAQKIKLRNNSGGATANQSVTFNVAEGMAATDLQVSSVLVNGNGANGVIKTGAGTLAISGANSYTGGTAVNGGTLALSGAGTLGAPTTTLTFGGSNTSLALGSTTQTVAGVTGGNSSSNYSFGIAGPGTLNVSGHFVSQGNASNGNPNGATATLSSADINVAGDMGTGRMGLVIGGTSVVSANRIGGGGMSGITSADWGQVTIQDNAVVTATNGIVAGTTAWGLNLNGGTLITKGIDYGPHIYAGGTTNLNFNGTLVKANQDNTNFITYSGTDYAAPAIQTGGAKIDTQSYNITIGLGLGGTGALTKSGSGTLILNGASGYTGGTTVIDGTLATGTSGTLGTGNLTVATGAVCDLRNTSTDGALANTSHVYINGTGKLAIATGVAESVARLYVDNALMPAGTYTAATHPALVSGAGSLVVSEGLPAVPSGLVASAASSSVINLTWSDNASNEQGYVVERSATTVDGFTLLATLPSNSTSHSDTGLTGDTTWFYRVRATNATFGDSGWSNEASATTPVALGDGVWTSLTDGIWSTSGNWQGRVIASGADKSATFAQSTGVIVTLDSNRSLGGLSFANANYTLAGTSMLTLDVATGTPGITVGDGVSATIGVPLAGNDGMAKSGNGSLVLTAASVITGAATVSAGTMVYQNSYASSSHAIAAGAVLELTVASGSRDSAATTFSGAGTLRKSGSGEVFWGSGSATFALDPSSLIDVQGGTLKGGSYANEVWTNNKSDLNVASGAVFDGVEANVRVNKLTGDGSIKTGYSGAGYQNLTIGVDNGSSTFAGSIQNSVATGNLVKAGTGAITLAGANNHTGTTTVTGGSLVLAHSQALQSSTLQSAVIFDASVVSNAFTIGSLSTSANLALQNNATTPVGIALSVGGNHASTTMSGILSGTGSLIKTGSGQATLTNSNTFTGGVNINEGLLVINADSGLGAATGAVAMNGGTLKGGGALILGAGRTITLGANGGYFANGSNQSWMVHSRLTGTGILGINYDSTAAHSLTFTSTANDYAGETRIGTTAAGYYNNNVAAAILKLGAADVLPYGTGKGNVVVGYQTNGTATAVLDLNGFNLKINGLSSNNAGYASVNNSSTTAATLALGHGDATAEFAGLIRNTGAGALGLIKTGTGNQTLSGANTYGGGTNVVGGTLTLSGLSASLGTGDLAVASGATCALANPNGSISDTAAVFLTGTAKLDIASGVTETVRFLYIDGALQDPGTYTAVNLPSGISGTGSLVVSDGLTPAEIWRDTHFGTTANDGTAADAADPDKDGFANLLERAFGMNPLANGANRKPAVDTSGATFSMTYTKARAATDLAHVVQVSPDLGATPWRDITPSDGSAALHDDTQADVQVYRFTATSTAARQFYRVVVRPAP